MKILICLLYLLPAFAFAAPHKGRESVTSYSVTYKKNTALKATQGEAVIKASADGSALSGRLKYGVNGSSKEMKLQPGGKFTLSLKPGKHVFQFWYDNNHEEIRTDSIVVKGGMSTIITLDFQNAMQEAEKPVIYFYPEKDLDVTATIVPTGEFIFTYPAYENGWKGIAHPDGSISISGKTYPYLFWEATTTTGNPFSTLAGFYVTKENVTAFLEEKLTAIGLTAKEQTDFITYWGPRLASHERCAVHFLLNSDCTVFAELSVAPAPDHLNRVYIAWIPVNDLATPDLAEQKLQFLDRSGFDVLEWGGSELPVTNLFFEQTSTLKP